MNRALAVLQMTPLLVAPATTTSAAEDPDTLLRRMSENREPLELSEDGLEFSDVCESFDVHAYRIMLRQPEGEQ